MNGNPNFLGRCFASRAAKRMGYSSHCRACEQVSFLARRITEKEFSSSPLTPNHDLLSRSGGMRCAVLHSRNQRSDPMDERCSPRDYSLLLHQIDFCQKSNSTETNSKWIT